MSSFLYVLGMVHNLLYHTVTSTVLRKSLVELVKEKEKCDVAKLQVIFCTVSKLFAYPLCGMTVQYNSTEK